MTPILSGWQSTGVCISLRQNTLTRKKNDFQCLLAAAVLILTTMLRTIKVTKRTATYYFIYVTWHAFNRPLEHNFPRDLHFRAEKYVHTRKANNNETFKGSKHYSVNEKSGRSQGRHCFRFPVWLTGSRVSFACKQRQLIMFRTVLQ